jgi:glucan phosphoethanolaminetransferase (alkaline phosphatase superfamily)
MNLKNVAFSVSLLLLLVAVAFVVVVVVVVVVVAVAVGVVGDAGVIVVVASTRASTHRHITELQFQGCSWQLLSSYLCEAQFRACRDSSSMRQLLW